MLWYGRNQTCVATRQISAIRNGWTCAASATGNATSVSSGAAACQRITKDSAKPTSASATQNRRLLEASAPIGPDRRNASHASTRSVWNTVARLVMTPKNTRNGQFTPVRSIVVSSAPPAASAASAATPSHAP